MSCSEALGMSHHTGTTDRFERRSIEIGTFGVRTQVLGDAKTLRKNVAASASHAT